MVPKLITQALKGAKINDYFVFPVLTDANQITLCANNQDKYKHLVVDIKIIFSERMITSS